MVQSILPQKLIQETRDLIIIHIRESDMRAALKPRVLPQQKHLRIAAIHVNNLGRQPCLRKESEVLGAVVAEDVLDRGQLGELLELRKRDDQGSKGLASRHVEVVREDVAVALVRHDRLGVGRVAQRHR